MASAEIHHNNQNLLGKRMSLKVIFPDSGEGPFPVLYLLHGLSDNHLTWTQLTSVERYVGGLPLIVVMPDGERGFYCDNDSRPFARYESYLVQEVLPLVDRTFNTIKSRFGRALSGNSMGGYGSIKLALKYPELFASAASLSGALQFANTTIAEPSFIHEYAPVVGLPVPGGSNDLFKIVEDLPVVDRPDLFLSCGANDYLIHQNRAFAKRLTDLGYEHEYQEHPGAHDWEYWNKHILYALRFLFPRLGAGEFDPIRFL